MFQKIDFDRERERMVIEQLEARGIRDKRALAAFRKVPRDRFIPPEHRAESYADHPVPIGWGQTISQPYMVALMTEHLALKEADRVLEIGTGSGYQAAILAELCSEMYTVERLPYLSESARRVLHEIGYSNIMLKVGDGSCGWKEYAPYNGIIVTAGTPTVPPPLKEQLALGGRLAVPVGDGFSQMLKIIEKEKDGFKETEVCACVFVPLVGEYGWSR